MKNKETLPTQEVRYSEKSKPIEFKLVRFEGVQKFKSIARAIRKGYVTPTGVVAPSRPFNNRADKSRKGNSLNTLKRQYYGELVRG